MFTIRWLLLTRKIDYLVGATIDNLYKVAIFIEKKEYESAQRISKNILSYQFKKLAERNISPNKFFDISNKVRPKEKVEKALNFFQSIQNDSDLNNIFGACPKIGGSEINHKEIEEPFKKINIYLFNFGYKLTDYGIAVSIFELMSEYTEAEIAMHIALITLALDMKEAGNDILKMMTIFFKSRRTLIILNEYQKEGLIRQELWENDSLAIYKVGSIDEMQKEWIDKVLSDPIVGKKRLAVSID